MAHKKKWRIAFTRSPLGLRVAWSRERTPQVERSRTWTLRSQAHSGMTSTSGLQATSSPAAASPLRHTCNNGAGPHFGHTTPGCPRCEELLAATPRPEGLLGRTGAGKSSTATSLVLPGLAANEDGRGTPSR